MLAKEAAYVYDDPNYSQLVHQILTTSGYDIDQVFDDPNTGFQAIGLTSTTPDKPPVLVFRGTNEPLAAVTIQLMVAQEKILSLVLVAKIY
jgi:hypothetical protein